MSNKDTRILGRGPLPAPRLSVLCEVTLEADLFGSSNALVRDVSPAGAFIQTHEPLPLGTKVRVRFGQGDDTIVAHARVQNRYSLNFADAKGPNALSGMMVQFSRFEADEDGLPLH